MTARARLRKRIHTDDEVVKGSPQLNFLAGCFSFASVSAFGIASIALASRFLDQSEIGLWNLTTYLTSFLVLLDLGLGNSCARLMAKPLAEDDQSSIQRSWSTLAAMLAGSSVLIIAFGMVFATAIPQWLRLSGKITEEAGWLIGGMILIHSTAFLGRAWSGVLTCQERFHWVLFLSGIMPWVQFSIFGICLVSGLGLASYLVGTGVATMIQNLWLWRLVGKGPHQLRFSRASVDRTTAKEMLRFSLPMLAWSSAPVVLASVPAWVIGRMSGTEAVAAYTVTMRLPQMASMLAMRAFHAYVPKMQNQHLNGEHQSFYRNYRYSTALSMTLSWLLLVLCMLFNRDLVSWLTSDEYFSGFSATFWICCGFLIGAMTDHLGTMLVISGNPGRIAMILMIELLLTVACTVVLWHSHGITGVLAGAAIGPLMLRLPYLLRTAPRRCGFDAGLVYGRTLVMFCSASAFLALVWVYDWETASLVRYILVPIIIAITFLMILQLRRRSEDKFETIASH